MSRRLAYKNRRPSPRWPRCWCVVTTDGGLNGEQWWFWSKAAAVEFVRNRHEERLSVMRFAAGYYIVESRSTTYHIGTWPVLCEQGWGWALNKDLHYVSIEGMSPYVASQAIRRPTDDDKYPPGYMQGRGAA